ncbi:putative phage abortive infection protein [Bacillus velezensis]|uniref:putative phage abortive infection protein n=1 Tax=Bacillus velezensis TaxID=492670 RepID=UPI002E1EB888|nr:putative phage abortive infection protein [Bacillus velezensis]
MSSENEKKDKWYGNENFWMWAGITACGVALIIPFAILICTNNLSLKGIDGLGTFGDFFGGTTVGLFNLSSILLVLTAVIMQRKELEQTRREFVKTNETLTKQQFDNTFFNMINLHNEIVRTLNDNGTSGKELLGNIEGEISYWVESIDLDLHEDEYAIELLITSYERAYKNYDNILGHYLRNLYRIVKFIDEAKLSKKEKKNYIGILRAQLTIDELLIIFYNALSIRGMNFKDIITKYNFFDNHLDAKAVYNRYKMFLQ